MLQRLDFCDPMGITANTVFFPWPVLVKNTKGIIEGQCLLQIQSHLNQ